LYGSSRAYVQQKYSEKVLHTYCSYSFDRLKVYGNRYDI
jgi:hypothetical protein